MIINNIPQGYKDSPLGVIPQEWEVKRLGEVCDFLDNKRVPIKDADRSKMQGCYPYYGASGIIDYVNDYIFDDDLILLGEDGANIINRSTPLAFLVSGKVWVNNHAHVLKAKESNHRYYVCAFLESLKYDKYNTGTAQPKLNREVCSNIEIACPPLPEQQRIAEVLGTWDVAIEKQGALVDKLTERKRALMQQLLTGKKRLPNFSEPWETVRLGEIGSIITGSTPPMNVDEYYGGNSLWATAIDFKGMYLKDTQIKLSELGAAKYRVVPKGSVLVTCIASIGKNVIADTELSFNQQINAIIPNKNYKSEFVYFQIENSINKLHEVAGAGAVKIINKTSFANIKLEFPSLPEQTAIAQILTTADREIEGAKAKLESLRSQKRGLMQQLLSGKKRIKI